MHLDKHIFTHDALGWLDGRCRVLSALALIVATVSAESPYFIAGLALLCAIPLARNARVAAARLLPVNLILVPIWINVLFGLSAETALRSTLRVNTAALLAMTFVVPMRIETLSRTLAALKTPRKLVALLVLTHRHLFVLAEGLTTALTSMRLRSRSTAGEWKALANIFAVTLVKSIDTSTRVSQAMAARGFTGTLPSIRLPAWRLRDTLFLAGTIALAVCGWLVER